MHACAVLPLDSLPPSLPPSAARSVVLVALGSSLEQLAERVGTVSTEVGSVFIARGVGAIFGAIFSAKLYGSLPGNTAMMWVLLSLGGLLLWLPFESSLVMLHFSFFLLGLCTAMVDTGCQIMSRRVHGSLAGPWLGANTVAFGLSGALVPLIGYLTSNLIVQYSILAGLSAATALFLLILPTPETQEGFIAKRRHFVPAASRRHGTSEPLAVVADFLKTFQIEFLISFMVFWLIGGKVGITAYITEYVMDLGVLPSSDISLLITVLWLAISVGRLIGIQLQRSISLGKLYGESLALFIAGAVAILFLPLFPHSQVVLWLCVSIYGVVNGPTVGYAYDLNNRLTVPSETGMSIVMFGLNCGSSFIPFSISKVWSTVDSPEVLSYFVLASQLLPIPALLMVRQIQRSAAKRAMSS
jgi:predicted MFS family arabinose efflux permease